MKNSLKSGYFKHFAQAGRFDLAGRTDCSDVYEEIECLMEEQNLSFRQAHDIVRLTLEKERLKHYIIEKDASDERCAAISEATYHFNSCLTELTESLNHFAIALCDHNKKSNN